MRLEKHIESLNEVMDEVKNALEDPKGIKKHQRRLAMMLSLGICELIEIYFHKLGIMKEGSRIKHDMAYGAPVKEEDLLKEKINDFLKLKRIIESEVGGIIESK